VPGTRCGAPGTRCGARSDASKQAVKSVPGTRCGARSDASKQAVKSVPGTRCDARSMLANRQPNRCRRPNRCQAPGATPGQMLANRWPRAAKSVPGTRCGARSMLANMRPKSVPGTRCGARSDASRRPNRCQAPGATPGQMLANRWSRAAKSVPGTRCGARSMLANMRPKSVPGTRCGATRAAVHRLAADGYGKRDKGRPKSVPGTRGGGLRRLRQWSKASPVAAPPRDLRAYDHHLGFSCCPPPAT
jgi:hypothetical protein